MTKEEQMWKAVEDEHGTLSPRESYVTLTAMEYGYNLAIEQACEYLKRFVCTSDVIETNEKGEPLADSFVEVGKRRLEAEKAFIEDFKQAMKL